MKAQLSHRPVLRHRSRQTRSAKAVFICSAHLFEHLTFQLSLEATGDDSMSGSGLVMSFFEYELRMRVVENAKFGSGRRSPGEE